MFGFGRKKALRIGDFINPEQAVLRIASTDVITCGEHERVDDTIRIMLRGIRTIPVIDRKGFFSGYITTRDVLDFLGGGVKHRFFRYGRLNASVRRAMNKGVCPLSRSHTISAALEEFKKYGQESYPIIHRRKILGLVSDYDFITRINRKTGIRVGDIRVRKPMVVTDNHSIVDVAKMMCMGPYQRLPVVKNGVLIGIVTPHDIISYLSRHGRLDALETEQLSITRAMNSEVVAISEEADIYDAVMLMKNRETGGLPVVRDLELLGIITKRDIIDAFA